MHAEATKARVELWMQALGTRVRSPLKIYLVGGATAVLEGWRETTIDIDLKAEPEVPGFFEAIAELKESLDVNIELASPEQFIPEHPGWRERSPFLARHGVTDFYAYDFYSQALAKLERGHPRDLADVQTMRNAGKITARQLRDFFLQIEPALLRFPAIEPAAFAASIDAFCEEGDE
ncbi:MAG: DUF6036 family nucleotidyltransferase [Verrucomicrobiota bacterium]